MRPRKPTPIVMPACPACPAGPEWTDTAVRTGLQDLAEMYPALDLEPGTVSPVTDIGYRCRSCLGEWGFELFPRTTDLDAGRTSVRATDASR